MMLEAKDIRLNCTYRAKRPKKAFGEVVNDRIVLYISPSLDRVQYDSDSIAMGRHYPTVPMEKFLKWASHEVAH